MENKNNLIKNSYIFFNNFVESNNLILDEHFDNINIWYNSYIENDKIDNNINDEYKEYINIFKKHMNNKKKNKFNYIYYIIILYYIDPIKLYNFTRFYISKINYFKNLQKNTLKINNEIINNWKNKNEISKSFNISIIKDLVNLNDVNFILFFICIQNYLI
jgi:hypothetical protein